jgi:serine/threonine protein phosphatase 1
MKERGNMTDRCFENFKRVIAIGDIHGHYDLLKNLIETQIKFNPKTDLLIFLGDYIDRGFSVIKVITYLDELKKKYPDNIILLMGNHEEMAKEWLEANYNYMKDNMWLSNGGRITLQAFNQALTSCSEILLPFIAKLKPYYETDNFIFVHGGIGKDETLKETAITDLLWNRTTDYNGIKTLVKGHTPVEKVFWNKFNNTINVDSGAFYTGVLSGFDVLSGQVFQAMTEKAKRKTTYQTKELYKNLRMTDEEIDDIAKDILSSQDEPNNLFNDFDEVNEAIMKELKEIV